MADITVNYPQAQSAPLQNLNSIVNTMQGMQTLQKGKVELEKSRALLKPQIRAGEAEATTAEQTAEQKKFETQQKYTQTVREITGGLIGNAAIIKGDHEGTVKVLSEARQRMIDSGVPSSIAESGISRLMSQADKPGAVLQGLHDIIRGQAGAANQAGVINTPLTPVATQNAVTPMQLQPNAPGAVPAGKAIPMGVSPTQTQEPKTDVLGNPYVQTRDQQGNLGAQPAPNSNTPPLLAMPQGETTETAKQLSELRLNTNKAAAAVPEQRFNNAEIIRLAPQALTGTGGETLTKLLNAVGIQRTNDIGADTKQLEHFIARQTVSNAGAMGADTDAARQLAERAVVGAKSPSSAIVRMAKVNDAYNTGIELFNKGLEAAIKSPDNKVSIFAARDFQNQWSQAFDPQVMMLHNAYAARNKAGNLKEKNEAQKDIDEMVKAFGGKGSPGVTALIEKYKKIDKLSNTGRP